MKKSTLTPASVFEMFERINAVPRPSKHEEKMIEFLADFGRSLGLDTVVDETGNVLIRKPASPGMENRPTVILQSHMDMVCEKNNDVAFDFLTDAIQTYVDGDWMKARGIQHVIVSPLKMCLHARRGNGPHRCRGHAAGLHDG